MLSQIGIAPIGGGSSPSHQPPGTGVIREQLGLANFREIRIARIRNLDCWTQIRHGLHHLFHRIRLLLRRQVFPKDKGKLCFNNGHQIVLQIQRHLVGQYPLHQHPSRQGSVNRQVLLSGLAGCRDLPARNRLRRMLCKGHLNGVSFSFCLWSLGIRQFYDALSAIQVLPKVLGCLLSSFWGHQAL